MKKFLALLAFGALCTSAEAQGFSAWSSFTNNPNLTVESAAAFPPTSFGMQVVVNDADILLVRDNSPTAEPRYRARFYINTNNYTLGDAVRQRILMAQRDSDNQRLVTIIFRHVSGGQVSFLATVWEDSGLLRSLPLGVHAEGWRQIEFDWQKATAPGANNGHLQVWVDGVVKANAIDLDNDLAGGIDFARMGVMNPVVGSGTFFFDEFESRRQTFIGALP